MKRPSRSPRIDSQGVSPFRAPIATGAGGGLRRLAAGACLALGAVSCASPGRPGSAGVVSSATPEATAAGVEILEAGGNAIDAAVAIAFALGVTEPAGSGLGGQTILIVHPPGAKPFVINGTSRAPLALPAKVTLDDLVGHRATTVPSTVRVLDFAWRKHGSGRIPWAALLAPAIRYAEEGYALGHFRHRSLARYAHRLRSDEVVREIFLGPGGEVPAPGTIVRQTALARTLRRLAEAGADDFYRGEIGRRIDADMRAHGGWVTLADLEGLPEPAVAEPLHGTYRGWDVYSLPPPAGGWVVLQTLNLLEKVPPRELAADSDRRWIWLAETLRVSHGNRLQSPVEDLADHDAETRRKIDKATADRLWTLVERPDSGETTHFSVVDRDGLCVGVSASINAYFGARTASAELGFLYNDYMHEFTLDAPGHPFHLRSGGMPYSSMSASILARDSEPGLVTGSPGSKRIISAVVQVISHWVDGGHGIDAAVAAPRLHVVPDDDLFVEARQARFSAGLLLELELRGYNVVRPFSSLYRENLNPYFGGVHAVARESDAWTGAADPRRDGAVGLPDR